MFPIELETQRLSIREFAPDDVATVIRYSAEQQGIFFHEKPALTQRDVESWLNESLRLAKSPNACATNSPWPCAIAGF